MSDETTNNDQTPDVPANDERAAAETATSQVSTHASEDGEHVIGADGHNHGRIDEVNLESEMQRSYLDYAMSVIVGRALPDVRDGLKPVHRRILYTMYDGGYRPNAGFYKCGRVVGDVMGKYHPHGDSSVYDALVRLAQDWNMRYPMVAGQGNFGSPGNLGAAAMRYTECKMAPLAMEMVKGIDEDTVDFQDNYDGREKEPMVLPARLPNLLLNGSEGIAVGMATRIPPHNLREVGAGVQWALDHPEASREELLEALMQRISGPDFPTGATILGRRGIEDAYRTGRGSIVQRAVVEMEEIHGRNCLVVKELPYQVNPDNLVSRIVELVKAGQLTGISDIRDETSNRSGMRLIIVLRRDAVAKVVLNNLYKRTALQDSFPANMLALVDGVPRTLSLDGFIRHWITHQMEVIVRRTQFRLNKAKERLHILEGYLKALDNLDEVIALIRRSPTADEARVGLMSLLDIDEVQADAILALQLRRLAALERQKILDEHASLKAQVEDLEDIIAKPERQRAIIGEELAEIVDRYGDERKTTILPFDGEMSMEDLIPEENVVVTVTRDGFAKRTRTDAYRAQKRGGKGVKGAQLRDNDIVEHFFVTTTHHWLLFFTDQGRVYRIKGYEIPEGGRDGKGQHVANLLAFQPGESIASVLALRSYDDAEYLALATRAGMIKKTRLSEYDSRYANSGLKAINLTRDEDDNPTDAVVSATILNSDDDVIMISCQGQAARFTASDDVVRPLGRATGGVRGMRFRGDDQLLTMRLVREGADLLTMTDEGYAKRTPLTEYPVKGRGILGVKAMQLTKERGHLIGALVVEPEEDVMVIMQSGKLVRVSAADVRPTGRNTQGVIFARPDKKDKVIAITRNTEADLDEGGDGEDSDAASETDATPGNDAPASPMNGVEDTDPVTSDEETEQEDAE